MGIINHIKRHLILLVVLLGILFFIGVSAYTSQTTGVGHNPEEIGPGTFGNGTGNYTFPTSINILQNLNTQGNINTENQLCIKNNCINTWPKEIQPKDCGQNYTIKEIANNGTPICGKKIPTGNCSPGKIITEIDNNGNIICSNIEINTTRTCSLGQHMSGITNNGSIICSNHIWPSGNYCIIQGWGQTSCPTGFTLRSLHGITIFGLAWVSQIKDKTTGAQLYYSFDEDNFNNRAIRDKSIVLNICCK